MSSVYHISVCLPYDTRNPIQQTSESKGFRFINLPRFLNGDSQYVHVKKLKWTRDFITENNELHDSVVMFTDAHDVLILSDASDIVGRFFHKNCDLLFSAEKLFSPWLADEKPYRVDIKRYFETCGDNAAPYPNSGCWIGYGWAALKFLNAVIEYADIQQDSDDQRVVQDILANGTYPADVVVNLDTEQELFVSVIANGDDLRWNGNRIFYKARNDPVPVFHANGYKKPINFIDIYSSIFHGTTNKNIEIKAVKNSGKYLGVTDGRFTFSDNYGATSLSVLIKANRVCCFFTNDGSVIGFEPDSMRFNVTRLVVDNWERRDIRKLNETMSPYLGVPADITFEHHILNHIWGFYTSEIDTDLTKYFYNL